MESTQAKKPEVATTFKVGGVEVDFSRIPALTVGDKKILLSDQQYGVDFGKLRDLSPDGESKLVLFLCRKLRPETTMADVDALTIFAAQRIMAIAGENAVKIDPAFSTPSTSSPAGTVGGQTKS